MGRFFLIMAVGFLLLSALGCDRSGGADQAAQAQPAAASPDAGEPVTADDELLLLEDENPAVITIGPMADNSRCLVCHVNFEQEELTLQHARADIGCAKCHGDSDAHIADESWASGGNGTAPEIMYPPEEINPGCSECHKEIDPGKHKEFLAGESDEKYCTQCHGQHRMANRKCKWK